jgi:hypothetical protein
LTPEAEELVRAGRAALRPSDADRERVLQALLPRLDAGLAGAGISEASRVSALAKSTLIKVTTVLVGLGVAGGGLYGLLRPEPPPAISAASVPAEPAATRPAPIHESPGSAPSGVPQARAAEKLEFEPAAAIPQAQSAEKRAAGAPRPADSLAQEVAILSRASSELHAGRPAAALKALAEHQRKFPNGALAQERASARVQALCAMGQSRAAQGELARLAKGSPSSPHVVRARKACGSGTAGK